VECEDKRENDMKGTMNYDEILLSGIRKSLIDIRWQTGITFLDLSKEIGISLVSLHAFVNDPNRLPHPRTCAKLKSFVDNFSSNKAGDRVTK